MKKLLVPIILVLSGCSATVPVSQTFPDVSPSLTEKCQDLMKIEGENVAITELLKTVIQNYSLYHQCSNKVEGLNEWYTKQKEIFNKANTVK